MNRLQQAELEGCIAESVVAASLEIVDLRFLTGGRIEITVDRDGQSVDLEALTACHRRVAQALAENGHDPEEYHLEVQSPGLDRKLTREKDFDRFKGCQVAVKLRQKVDGRIRLKGELLGLRADDCFALLEVKEGEMLVERSNVKQVRLIPDL